MKRRAFVKTSGFSLGSPLLVSGLISTMGAAYATAPHECMDTEDIVFSGGEGGFNSAAEARVAAQDAIQAGNFTENRTASYTDKQCEHRNPPVQSPKPFRIDYTVSQSPITFFWRYDISGRGSISYCGIMA